MKLPDYKQIIGLHQLNSEQKLLLQATVLQGAPALNAWEQWQSTVDLDTLDPGSDALLCQLYSNLVTHQVEHSHMARLKGIYRRNWCASQLLLKKLELILKVLQQEDIKTIILGDAATVLGYFPEGLQRPIYNFNLLLQPTEKEKAIAILEQQGWSLVKHHSPSSNGSSLSCQLQDSSGTRLHLQEQLFWAVPQEYTTQQLWTNAIPCQVGDLDALRLSYTDLFLHLCLRAFYFNQTPQIIFFADAVKILQQHQGEINWLALVTQAQRYQTILPVRNMLTVLNQLFNLDLPDWVLSALHQMPVGHKEFLQYQILPQRKRTIIKSILFRTANSAQLITP